MLLLHFYKFFKRTTNLLDTVERVLKCSCLIGDRLYRSVNARLQV